jgi:radical SAM protein with 4Fe4S-binding SPASM domain
MFTRLAEIDRTEFGRDWLPRPPLVGHTCLRHQFSCTVTTDGHVQPCVGVDCALGSVRKAPLKQLLRDSEMMEVLRYFRENIKGPCAQCELSDECYGCRGAAWQLTGDALASDPLCWRNTGETIPKLPTDAAPYVPQEPPMRMVTRLLSVGEKTTEAEAVIAPDAVCLRSDGTMEPAFYAELAAQAFGAGISFRNWRRNGNKAVEGLLLGMSGFQIHGVARVGDTLTITVRTACEMDGFAVLDGRVSRGEEVLAEGSLKVCNQPLPKAGDE